MEVLGIVCSPRKNGNTEILMRQALLGASETGARTEISLLCDKKISPCKGCGSCIYDSKCRIEDDMQPIYEKLLKAKGVIFGTPIYFFSMSGQAKVLLDRTFALRYPDLKLASKYGGIITVGSGTGASNVIDVFNFYFIANRMIPTDYVNGFASAKGAIEKDVHAMKSAFELGRLIAMLTEQEFKFPQDFNLPLYRMVDKKYSLDHCPIK